MVVFSDRTCERKEKTPPFSFNRSIYLTVVSEVAFDPLVQSGVRPIPADTGCGSYKEQGT
ncbi:MAG: hypothetical protein DRQ02_03405 [Candidatus Latescibacterota bacterium]|nr:MAG: hypothetical protein DRQ02_03405 [Candidatus Latescibacterota bacterium]